ncbi:class I adenylate-forming enzyme family protein [Pseudochelatococcus sp. B33]
MANSWQPRTVWQVVEAGARDNPDKEIAVIERERLTFGRLAERAKRLSAHLAALGLKPGDRVALWLENSAAWIVVFCAVARLGAVLVPVNTRSRPAELDYLLAASEPSILVLGHDLAGKTNGLDVLQGLCPGRDVARAGERWPSLRHVIGVAAQTVDAELSYEHLLADGSAGGCPAPEVRPDDPAIIQFTSGTTGRPKGAVLTHNGMVRNAFEVGVRIGLGPDDRLFSPLPFFHVGGLVLAVLACIVHRATVVSAASFVPEGALAVMEDEQCTLIGALETLCLGLLDCPRLPDFKLRIRGGFAPGPALIARRMRDELGAEHIVNIFGLSEASSTCAAPSWADEPEIRTDTVGDALPGIEIGIFDEKSGERILDGRAGEIRVKGFNVMLGYFRDPESTARVLLPDGWLRTGDLGAVGADGKLRISGRLKEIIRSGGENYSPVEVEEALMAHPSVSMAAVAPVADAHWGEVGWAFVKLRGGHEHTKDVELLEYCRERLSNFKVPRRVIFVDTVPLSASGKIQKSVLLDGVAERGRSSAPAAKPGATGGDTRNIHGR